MLGEISLEAFGKFAAGKHDASSTASAFEANVRAEACDGPFVGAAGMLLAKPQVIVELKIRKHVSYQ